LPGISGGIINWDSFTNGHLQAKPNEKAHQCRLIKGRSGTVFASYQNNGFFIKNGE
jgi:hypothetical protein